jgi:hypothetical protein
MGRGCGGLCAYLAAEPLASSKPLCARTYGWAGLDQIPGPLDRVQAALWASFRDGFASLDPALTGKDLGACEETGGVQASAGIGRQKPFLPPVDDRVTARPQLVYDAF